MEQHLAEQRTATISTCQHADCHLLSQHQCSHCQRWYCRAHIHFRSVRWSSHQVAYCVVCSAAIDAGDIYG